MSNYLINKLFQILKFSITGLIFSLILNYIFELNEMMIETSLIGVLIASLVGVFEVSIAQKKFRKLKFSYVLLLRTLIYTSIILFAFAFLGVIKLSLLNQCTLYEAMKAEGVLLYLYEHNFHLLLLFLISLSFFINFIWQINLLLGPGVLLKYIAGKYHKPVPEKKIFLFLDLNNSTPTAERLGTQKYSAMLKDVFSDITEPLLR